jgi:hypothetical protein
VPYSELLRSTVVLAAGAATALAAVSVIGIQRAGADGLIITVAAVWWIAAAVIGTVSGSSGRIAEGVRRTLAEARTVGAGGPGVSLPAPGRIALARLWPILAAVVIAGGLGIFLPEVAVIGSGYALLVALAWRNRESAVLAIEGRDGVRFLVESGSALRPVKLIRSPGFTTL